MEKDECVKCKQSFYIMGVRILITSNSGLWKRRRDVSIFYECGLENITWQGSVWELRLSVPVHICYLLTYVFPPCSRVLLEKLIGFQLVRHPPHFKEPEESLPSSQAAATCPYP